MQRYLKALSINPSGKMSIDSLAAVAGIDIKTVRVEIEPFLLSRELITITGGGRQITPLGLEHLGEGCVSSLLARTVDPQSRSS